MKTISRGKDVAEDLYLNPSYFSEVDSAAGSNK